MTTPTAQDTTRTTSADPQRVHFRRTMVDGASVFYREAGDTGSPTILLLHGFPSSSHMFRDLIPLLAGTHHVIAPDYPGFGFSDAPSPAEFAYTFDHLAGIIERFVDQLGVRKLTLYVHDYGGPIGFRLATKRPELVEGLVVQNAIAHLDGVGPALAPLMAYWENPVANEAGARTMLAAATTRAQYEVGSRDVARLAPEAWTLDQALLDRPGNDQIQLALLYDYRTNVPRLEEWQAYLRTHRPPMLVLWGTGDPFFTEAGAAAYLRDVPEARLVRLDGGHFALEDHADVIAREILALRSRTGLTTTASPRLWGVATITAKPGREAELHAALAHVVVESRKEAGNRSFDLFRSVATPATFVIHESWRDDAALQHHFGTPHVQGLIARFGELAVAPIDVVPLEVLDRA